MKRKFFIFLLISLLIPNLAHSTRWLHSNIYRMDATGAVVANATVTVYKAGTTDLATIYTAVSGGSADADSAVTTSSKGFYSYYVDDTDYNYLQKFKEVISKTGYATTTYDNLTVVIGGEVNVYTPEMFGTIDGADQTEINLCILAAASNGTCRGRGAYNTTATIAIMHDDANLTNFTFDFKGATVYSNFLGAIITVGESTNTYSTEFNRIWLPDIFNDAAGAVIGFKEIGINTTQNDYYFGQLSNDYFFDNASTRQANSIGILQFPGGIGNYRSRYWNAAPDGWDVGWSMGYDFTNSTWATEGANRTYAYNPRVRYHDTYGIYVGFCAGCRILGYDFENAHVAGAKDLYLAYDVTRPVSGIVARGESETIATVAVEIEDGSWYNVIEVNPHGKAITDNNTVGKNAIRYNSDWYAYNFYTTYLHSNLTDQTLYVEDFTVFQATGTGYGIRVNDNVQLGFGTNSNGDFTILYDETTDNRLEIESNLGTDTSIDIANIGAGVTNVAVDGSVTATGGFVGNASTCSVAAQSTIADSGGDTSLFCLFSTAATGSNALVSDAECTYNANTNQMDVVTLSIANMEYEGTADDYETTVAFVDPTADRTVTVANASGTVAMTSGANTSGTIHWGDGSASFDTGDEVCQAVGLTCADAFTTDTVTGLTSKLTNCQTDVTTHYLTVRCY
mgnify:CR=1 FL=1